MKKLLKINFSKMRNNKQIFILIILLFGIVVTSFTINLSNQSLINELTDDTSKSKDEFGEGVNLLPRTNDYSSFFYGIGEDINISLHESILNTTDILFPNLDNANNFFEPSPTISGFNSSFVNINLNGIMAHNRSVTIENEVSSTQHLTEAYYTSFEVKGDCYLDRISVYLNQTSGGDTFYVDIYNATLSPYNATLSHIKFDEDITGAPFLSTFIAGGNSYWMNFSAGHQLLNVSRTYNNTFFIQVSCLSANNGYWHYGSNGVTYDSIVWSESVGLPEIHKDMSLLLGLSPENNIPNPTDINLSINGTTVTDIAPGSGFWTTTKELFDPSGKLEFEITADWWGVSCTVSDVQINYTKTDLKATSQFYIPDSGLSVNWNITRLGGLNVFEAIFTTYKINFTLPHKWENLTAFNGPLNKTANISLGPIQNGYRELEVSQAGNGTYWHIIGFSKNLLKKIHTYVNTVEKEIVDNIDAVEFLANFSEIITDGSINLSVYSPAPGNYLNHTYYNSSLVASSEIPLGEWTISLNAIDYGQYKIQVSWNNNTAAGFLEKTLIIMAVTDLILISPLDGQHYVSGEILNITVLYNDTGSNQGNKGIYGATVIGNDSFSLVDLANGYYNILINTSIFNLGWNYIEIEASKQYHYNLSLIFSFYLQIDTIISPSNTINFGNVMSGANVSFTFNYSDIVINPIEGAIINAVSLPPGFSYNVKEEGFGNYSIVLHTIGVQASDTPYTCIFNISSIGYQTQNIFLNIRIISTQTDIKILSFYDTLIRKDGLNQTVMFYFNDTDTNSPINGLTSSDVYIKDYNTGTPRPFWLYTTATEGEYILNISISGLDSGWFQFDINVSLLPNYNWSIAYLAFYLRGNYTNINLISLSDPGGPLSPTGLRNFTMFEGSDLYIELNITDSEYFNKLIMGDADSYRVGYTNIGTGLNGTLIANLNFITNIHAGTIFTSNPVLAEGRYSIIINASRTNYEDATIVFNLTVIERYLVSLTIVHQPIEIDAGEIFNFAIKADYFNGTNWLPLIGSNIALTPYFNGIASTEIQTKSTNSTGEVLFKITVRNDARNMSLLIETQGTYYSLDVTLEIPISITPRTSSPGFDLQDLIPYLIIIVAVIATTVGSIIVYRKISSPKKRKVPIVLEDVKTIFDDAINLKHIFVFFKRTGTCIFFKSFVSEEIHHLLISGYIFEICSYSKDLEYQERVNKINYDDKTLLISDGEYIRIALLLTEKVSKIFHRNLIELVNTFEINYANELQNWRWQFYAFINAGTLVDEKLSTSINLPHEIAGDISSINTLRSPYSNDVLKIANEMVEESERNFLTFTTLLNKATEKTHRDTKEIFMGIKELRDKKILIPIEIDNIEAQPITQEELTVINQKVSALANLTPEEKEKVINNLAQIGSAERRVYMASLKERNEIVSAPIDENLGVTLIDNVKKAKKEINELVKIAQLARNEQDYMKAINLYRKALKVATEYKLARELEQLTEFIHSTESEKYFDLEER